MPGTRVHLDNPAFAGRLKAQSRRSMYERRAVASRPRVISDVSRGQRPAPRITVLGSQKAVAQHPVVTRPQPKPAFARQTRSTVLMRQVVTPKRKSRNRNRGRHLNVKGAALTSLAAILFVFGVGVGITQLNANNKVVVQAKTLAAQTAALSEDGSLPDGGLPSEDAPKDGNYRAAPDAPKKISIPDLGVHARVIKLGVKANNEVKTPNNIFDVGWFEGSAKPGELGAVFINGHVHGPTQPGTFYGLKKLKPGSKITIERGDGKVFTYSVVKTQSYDKDSVDMGKAFNSIVPGKPGLNLITCDGEFSTNGGYNKRVLVFAVQD